MLEKSRAVEIIKEIYPIDEMSPEEYAGRHSHELISLGLFSLEHDDSSVEAWHSRLVDVLNDKDLLDQLREQYLSPELCREVRQGRFEPF